MKKKRLQKALAEFKTLKREVAIRRDRMRKLYEEMEGVVNTLDRACLDLDSGLTMFESGIESMSEQL